VPNAVTQRWHLDACKPKVQILADASHARYTEGMKTATIPPVRIDPSFRKDIEQALEMNESLASLVEKAVRNEVTRRRVQSEFVRRGMAAISRTVAAGDGIPAETVIAKLEAKLAAARQAKSA
jgi:predicted transcriptional regulator